MPDQRTRDGLVRLARGCWLPAAEADDLRTQCFFALSVCSPDAVVGYATAARLHGLWLPSDPVPIHIVTATPERVARSMTRTRHGAFRAHRRRLTDEDRAVVQGVVATSVARTWVDLATTLSLPDLVAASDCALRQTTREEIAAALRRSTHLRGVRRARVAFAMLDERSRSRPESHLRVAITTRDLPAFEVNEPVYRQDGGWLAEPDLSLAAARLALEYQGAEHAEIGRMRRDITRMADLRSEGWMCLLYGPAEVFGRPWQIAAEMRRLVAERAPGLLRASARH